MPWTGQGAAGGGSTQVAAHSSLAWVRGQLWIGQAAGTPRARGPSQRPAGPVSKSQVGSGSTIPHAVGRPAGSPRRAVGRALACGSLAGQLRPRGRLVRPAGFPSACRRRRCSSCRPGWCSPRSRCPSPRTKYTWRRLPLDCSPKATGASSYLLLSCLATSVALWHGIRGLAGAVCARAGSRTRRRRTPWRTAAGLDDASHGSFG